ncbi:MAG TPA: bifunctional (p)ppGpp synthetase/guanosine-3',5'-bis(diphosphate) 3'-pyrophosphohydrolase [Abditibacteriaceae bacterium]|jgi:GTP pyrophosphokinase
MESSSEFLNSPSPSTDGTVELDRTLLPDTVAIGDTVLSDESDGVTMYVGNVEIKSGAPEDVAKAQVKNLIAHTQQARPTTDSDLLMRAYDFAQQKHEGQKRRTGEPYIEHPIAVAGILAELGMDDPTLAAGLLHDVVEDCGVSYADMLRHFGPEVAQLVDGVTKLKHIDFNSKQEKQAENLRKLFLGMAGDVRVIIIKLCDRLHNMRTLDPFPEERRREIAAETLYIFAPIAHRLGIWRIKWELEDRSFKYLEPEIYKQIYALVQKTRAQRSDIVKDAIATLQERLRADNIEAEVTGRPKHFYSIYQKMIKQGRPFDDVHDLIALRIICPGKEDCYHALGIAHSIWMQIPEMFFDYISKPKPNNYQSLHTKVMGPDGEPFEIQIRTREMHREAEFGIAAHWRYKEGDAPSQNFGDKLRWLRFVLEMQSETQGDAEGFLDSLKLDLATDQIFAFTPRGDVIYLPQDSTPIDFAYRVHSGVGNAATGARVNGRQVPLDYKLHNGDICEIQTSKREGTGPRRDWLDFVVTPHAKHRIKSWLRKQNRETNLAEGRDRLEKLAQSERLKLGRLADNDALQKLAKTSGMKTANDVLEAIGYGELSAESVLRKIRAELESLDAQTKEEPLSGVAASILARRVDTPLQREATDAAGASNLAIGPFADGEVPRASGNLLFTLAKCCAPVPGDNVRGYTTRGRGITIHRADCPNLKHYEDREPGRLVPAYWTGESTTPYRALIALEARDRVGLLLDVTGLISARQINICGINTYPLKDSRARLNIAVTIASVQELDALMVALHSVEGVNEVHRV